MLSLYYLLSDSRYLPFAAAPNINMAHSKIANPMNPAGGNIRRIIRHINANAANRVFIKNLPSS